METKICPECRRLVLESASICPRCGTRIEDEAPENIAVDSAEKKKFTFSPIIIVIIVAIFLIAIDQGLKNGTISTHYNNNQSEISDAVSSPQSPETTISFSFGDRTGIYTGPLDADGLPVGYGTFESSNPDGVSWTYTGSWLSGHWNGNGKITWSDGKEYSGQFVDDMANGGGSVTTSDGTRYVGTFISGTGKTTAHSSLGNSSQTFEISGDCIKEGIKKVEFDMTAYEAMIALASQTIFDYTYYISNSMATEFELISADYEIESYNNDIMSMEPSGDDAETAFKLLRDYKIMFQEYQNLRSVMNGSSSGNQTIIIMKINNAYNVLAAYYDSIGMW